MTNKQRLFIHDLMAELLQLKKNKVIWAYQKRMPRQEKPFATLRIYSEQLEAMAELLQDGDTVHAVAPSSFVLEVQYFGRGDEEPQDKIMGMIRRLELPSVVDRCAAARVAFFDAEPVQDLSTLLDNQDWERRATVDLHVRYSYAMHDDDGSDTGDIFETIDTVDNVTIDGKMTENGGN